MKGVLELEFIRNNIDTIARDKIEEQMKTDKIHSTKEISVNNDLKDNTKKQYEKPKENNKRKSKVITVDGVKNLEDVLSVAVEKEEKIYEGNSKGRILDTRK